MDYNYYYKLRNSAAFKFNDTLEYNSKLCITAATTFKLTGESGWAVANAARMNAKYLPYKSQNCNYYNGGAANGDGAQGAAMMINLFSTNLLSSGY